MVNKHMKKSYQMSSPLSATQPHPVTLIMRTNHPITHAYPPICTNHAPPYYTCIPIHTNHAPPYYTRIPTHSHQPCATLLHTYTHPFTPTMRHPIIYTNIPIHTNHAYPAKQACLPLRLILFQANTGSRLMCPCVGQKLCN